jgi:hypothetical protein
MAEGGKPALNISSKPVLDGSPDPGADAVWSTEDNAETMSKRDLGMIEKGRFDAINTKNPNVGMK